MRTEYYAAQGNKRGTHMWRRVMRARIDAEINSLTEDLSGKVHKPRTHAENIVYGLIITVLVAGIREVL